MAQTIPDFTNPALFPTFHECPEVDAPPPPAPPTSQHYLLAHVKENMSITKPTLVCTDRSGAPFALVFEDAGLDLGAAGLRKGRTAVVPGARRTPPAAEGKRGFVRVPAGEGLAVAALPGALERVLALGGWSSGGEGEEEGRCEGCGREDGEVRACSGCGVVRYCGKECQAVGWTEKGHKADCKVLKAIREIWP